MPLPCFFWPRPCELRDLKFKQGPYAFWLLHPLSQRALLPPFCLPGAKSVDPLGHLERDRRRYLCVSLVDHIWWSWCLIFIFSFSMCEHHLRRARAWVRVFTRFFFFLTGSPRPTTHFHLIGPDFGATTPSFWFDPVSAISFAAGIFLEAGCWRESGRRAVTTELPPGYFLNHN